MCAHVSVAPRGVDGKTIGRLLFLFRSYYLSNFFSTYYEDGLRDQNCMLICLMILKKFGDIGDDYKFSEKSQKRGEKDVTKKRIAAGSRNEEVDEGSGDEESEGNGGEPDKNYGSRKPRKRAMLKKQKEQDDSGAPKTKKANTNSTLIAIDKEKSEEENSEDDLEKVGELVEEDSTKGNAGKKKGGVGATKVKSSQRAKASAGQKNAAAKNKASKKAPEAVDANDPETKIFFEMLKKHNLVVVQDPDE